MVLTLLISKGNNGDKNDFVPVFHEQCLQRKKKAFTSHGKCVNKRSDPRRGSAGCNPIWGVVEGDLDGVLSKSKLRSEELDPWVEKKVAGGG